MQLSAMIIVLFAAMIILFFYVPPFFQGQSAKAAVNRFYQYETAGNFGNSWELFHPQMQKMFSKDAYIQRRAHVFMQDFGVSTFRFELGQPKQLSRWRMSKDVPELAHVFVVPVVQHFQSAFGNFSIRQDVYAVKDNNQWRILWAYDER
ncbi:hypothetical protein [Gordoniibacillus kamchatkensis]|uniref:hypothetical protein n=1 Tax=Gordoniibacillus kamchatkensis TaxID=1590651 RepID=UPI0012E0B716|nr:hypothetical protein [Paenibacillus sp. VKM B-2647]